jgi:hypothetical protein
MRFSNSLMAGIAGTLVAGIVSAVSLIGTSDVNRDANVSATGSASLGGELPDLSAGIQAGGSSAGVNVKGKPKTSGSGSTPTAGGSINVTGGEEPGVDVTATVPGTGATPSASGTVTVKVPKLPLPTGGSTGGTSGGTSGGGTATVTIPDVAGLPELVQGLAPDVLNQVLPLLNGLSPDILGQVVGLLGAVDPADLGSITGLLGNLNAGNLTQFTNVLGLLSDSELPIVGNVLSSLGGLGGDPTAILGQLLSGGLPTDAVTDLLSVLSLGSANLGLLNDVLSVPGLSAEDLLDLDGILGNLLAQVLGLLDSLTGGLTSPVEALIGSLTQSQENLVGDLLTQLSLPQVTALGGLLDVADLSAVKSLLGTTSLLNDLPALGGLFSVSGGASTPAGSVFGSIDADGAGALAGLLKVVPVGSLGQVTSLLNLLG